MNKIRISDICTTLTDYVANGSFATLKENVKYTDENDGYARLIRLVDFNNNFSNKDAIYVNKNGYDFLHKSRLFGGEIIISNVGINLGTCFLAPRLNIPMTLAPNSVMLKTNQIDKYIFYYFLSERGSSQLKSLSSGSAIPKFNKTDLKKLEITIHDLTMQQHIVDTIGSVDDLIEKYEVIIKKLNQYLSSIFTQKAEFILEKKILGTLCKTITKGTTPTTLKKSFVSSGIPFVKVECLTDNHQIDTSKLAFIDIDTHKLLQRSQIQYKDLLLSIAGTIGRFAICLKNTYPSNTNQAIAIIRGKQISQEYLYALFLSGYCEEQITAKTVSGVQANLSLSVIASLEIPYIKDESFNENIKTLFRYIEQYNYKLLNLKKIKSQLLQKYFG